MTTDTLEILTISLERIYTIVVQQFESNTSFVYYATTNIVTTDLL